jgi:hypothetical protein
MRFLAASALLSARDCPLNHMPDQPRQKPPPRVQDGSDRNAGYIAGGGLIKISEGLPWLAYSPSRPF